MLDYISRTILKFEKNRGHYVEGKKHQNFGSHPRGPAIRPEKLSNWCKNLAPIVVAFANADGGDVVIGVEDDGRITGVNQNQMHLNELLRVPFDYCIPSVNADVKFIDCNDFTGNPNRVLVMHIPQSPDLHTNQADEAFYRVGDKSKKLNFEQRKPFYVQTETSYRNLMERKKFLGRQYSFSERTRKSSFLEHASV